VLQVIGLLRKPTGASQNPLAPVKGFLLNLPLTAIQEFKSSTQRSCVRCLAALLVFAAKHLTTWREHLTPLKRLERTLLYISVCIFLLYFLCLRGTFLTP
jgi:hypothetical protein